MLTLIKLTEMKAILNRDPRNRHASLGDVDGGQTGYMPGDWSNARQWSSGHIHPTLNEGQLSGLAAIGPNVSKWGAGSTGHRNTVCNLSAGVSKSKVFLGR
jgi:hypothetical protein